MTNTSTDILLTPACPGDLKAVVALLDTANLPTAGIEPHFDNFVVARDAGRVVGAIGFEAYGPDALLRSAIVESASRGRGLGRLLLEHILRVVRDRGVRTVYLLTTTVEALLAPRGFERCDRAIVPPAIANTDEFRSVCPAVAVCMRRQLDAPSCCPPGTRS